MNYSGLVKKTDNPPEKSKGEKKKSYVRRIFLWRI